MAAPADVAREDRSKESYSCCCCSCSYLVARATASRTAAKHAAAGVRVAEPALAARSESKLLLVQWRLVQLASKRQRAARFKEPTCSSLRKKAFFRTVAAPADVAREARSKEKRLLLVKLLLLLLLLVQLVRLLLVPLLNMPLLVFV